MSLKRDRVQYSGELITLPTGQKVPLNAVLDPELVNKKGKQASYERLPSITGSISGANSRFLSEYHRHRDRELKRIERMAEDDAREKDQEEFEKHREERKRALEDEAAKKRQRRQRRKHVSSSSEGLGGVLLAGPASKARPETTLSGELRPSKEAETTLPLDIRNLSIVDEE